MFTRWECTIVSGHGFDEELACGNAEVTLFDKDGEKVSEAVSSSTPKIKNKGCIFTTHIKISQVKEPARCLIKNPGGDSWRFGCIYLTNLTTGQSYMYEGTHDLKPNTEATFDLVDLKSSDEPALYDQFEIKFDIGGLSYTDCVWVKLTDTAGRSTHASMTGVPDIHRDWTVNTTQTSQLMANVGEGVGLGEVKQIVYSIMRVPESILEITKISVCGITDEGETGEWKDFDPSETILSEATNKWKIVNLAE